MFKLFDPRPRMCVFDVRETYKEALYVLANISLMPGRNNVYEGDLVAIADKDPESVKQFTELVGELANSGVKVLTGQSFSHMGRIYRVEESDIQ